MIGVFIPLPVAAAQDKPMEAVTPLVKPLVELPPGTAGFVDPTTGMEFVLVKGGCFKMGDSSGEGEIDEKPVHEVCLGDFAISKYEVTNAQYRLFMKSHSSGNHGGDDLNGDNQPVVSVNYRDDAVQYARWLSEKSGKRYRLPTEAEWEYAARAGTSTRNYWGDISSKACSYANVLDMASKRAFSAFGPDNHKCRDGYKVSAPVGSFKPNAFGLYDMMGNVWEWTSDWYDEGYYKKSPRDNPQGPSSGWARVIRGGGWNSGSRLIRSSRRTYVDPGFSLDNLGFRLVSPVQ
jgi:formylglycine-generating enzyme required for sulfatase activity